MAADERLQRAKMLIDQRRYLEARQMLENVPGAKADEWRRKLDERIGVQTVTPLDVPYETMTPPPPPLEGYNSAFLTPLEVDQRNQLLIMDDMTRAQARTKSYTGALIVVIGLYFVFFAPGLIANFLFYSDGRRMERLAGTSLPGVGGLGVLRFIMSVLLVVAVVAFVAFNVLAQVGLAQMTTNARAEVIPILSTYCQRRSHSGKLPCETYAENVAASMKTYLPLLYIDSCNQLYGVKDDWDTFISCLARESVYLPSLPT